MRIEEIMISPVVISKRNVTIANLKNRLARKGINAVPVMEDDGNIAGIVSASDLMSYHDESLHVEEVMSEHVHIVLRNNQVKDAAKIMVKHGVHHLVVMEDGNVIGMISSMDIIKVYAEE
ncbi:MAG: CBS domain-containing protein [Crocinitomicaceae bacterium]|nr:CBS domain-containing protein [Crocinitomicaceae bacterium]